MINQSHVGRTYPATEPYLVTAVKIAEFASALMDNNPAYAGREAIAPPTFGALIAAQAWGPLFSDPELGLELCRTMHADQRFELVRPMRVGDEVVAQLTIEKVRNRGSVAMITIRVDLATEQGESLGFATSTLLHNGPEEAK